MKNSQNIGRLLPVLVLIASGSVLAEGGLSEKDYFTELPEVLTVTRLAQPLSETPGAVTIIDRETIRRSGARELADVLRLVPGYIVGGFNGANPVAAYHAPIDTLGVRNLVLVDGRSIYSGYYHGGTQVSMMGLLMEDIERIEVLRGANSASFGANAMFGVINIITRHATDTRGAEISVSGGEGGVWDNMARIGWGTDAASFRLSMGRRQDSGYLNAHDDKIISQVHLRGDLQLAADQDLMFAAGLTEISGGDGFSGSAGNPLRMAGWHDLYLHGQWRRQLSGTDELKLTANFNEETFDDAYTYALDPSVTVGLSGRGRRTDLELQHQVGITPSLRGVWGAGYKHEEADSRFLYVSNGSVSMHEERVFGNLEWRPFEKLLVNAGGFWGRHSWKGSYFAPRLMTNLLVTPDHSLRAGVTKSTRMPTLFELAADVTYYPKNSLGLPLPAPGNILRDFPTNLFPYSALFNMPLRYYASSGNVDPERLRVQEIGYFGNFRDWRVTLDVRGYIEQMDNRIDVGIRTIPGYTLLGTSLPAIDYMNYPGFKTRGIEYQLRWKPFAQTELWLNQSVQRLIWDSALTSRPDISPPERATTVALFQKLPFNLDLSVMYHTMTTMTWATNVNDRLPERRRVDARLAWPFRIGTTRAEAAFTVQAANGNYPEYLLRKNFEVERRAFGTLRLSF